MKFWSQPENKKNFTKIFLIFLPMAALGTVSHELAHWSVAQYFGYNPSFHYGWVNYGESEKLQKYIQLANRYENGTVDQKVFEQSSDWKFIVKVDQERQWIILSGPFQTMLTGSLGLLWLLKIKLGKELRFPLETRTWLAIVLTLFWSRQVFNACIDMVFWLVKGSFLQSDEIQLAQMWGLPEWSISWGTGIVGGGVCILVTYWFPTGFRRYLLVAGTMGSVVGFVLWFGVLGPWLLP